MYNRYIRNDHGVYTRVSVDPTPAGEERVPPQQEQKAREDMQDGSEKNYYVNREAAQEKREEKASSSLPLGGFVERILGKFNLQDVDTGDIILLFLLFLLFEEKADEELLIALGLLLIL